LLDKTPSILLLAALAACTPAEEPIEDPTPAPFFEPDAPGPHRAGTDAFEFGSREGVPLKLQVWYPAAEYGDGEYRYGDLSAGGAPDWSTVDCPTPRPVLLFSHGNGGLAYQTWSVMEFFASHGWLVAAPGHTYNTIFDMDEDLWLEVALRRPWDIADSFDFLIEESSRSNTKLSGCVDPDAGYAVMGHSFGGFTSYAVAGSTYDVDVLAARCINNPEPACDAIDELADTGPGATIDHSDPRAWATVPWAPAWYDRFGEGLAQIDVPALVIGADRDATTPWDSVVEPSFAALTTTPRTLAQLTDAGHFSFIDFCTVVNAEDGCGETFRPYEDVLVTTRTAALAFLQRVQGEERAADWLPPAEGVTSWEEIE
jgi:predicted dienelactone hydrolase